MNVVVYLNWPESCFRANGADIAFLRTLLPSDAAVTVVRDDAAFLAALSGATHVLTWHFQEAWFASAPRLTVLATPAAGRELLPKAAPAGVTLHFGGFHGGIISETVLAFALAWKHGFFHRATVPLWPRAALADCCGDMDGTKAVILGYGRIGRAIGARLTAYGVAVRGFTHAECDLLRGSVPSSEREALRASLAAADWLIAALPSDTGTDGFVDAALLAELPPRCVFVNVGRGNCVDETALVAALRAKRLAGAYLDVYRNEPTFVQPKAPPPGVDIARADDADLPPTLVRMPHAAAYSPTYLRKFFQELKDDGLI